MNPFKAARVALGATQQEVADATGVARSTIASLETGIGIDPQTDQPIDRYHIMAAAFDGPRAQELEYAKRIVTERGYRIMLPEDCSAGCCARLDDLIEITVYAPDGVTAPCLADQQAVNHFRALAAQGRATGNYAGLEELRHTVGDDTYRVHIDTHAWQMTVYRHSAGADGKPVDPGVEVETVNL